MYIDDQAGSSDHSAIVPGWAILRTATDSGGSVMVAASNVKRSALDSTTSAANEPDDHQQQ